MAPHMHTRSHSTTTETPTEDEKRARQIQDILSSFDLDHLPSEFHPDIYDSLVKGNTPPSIDPGHYVQQSSLYKTLFHGCFVDDAGFQMIRSWHSDDILATAFCQTLDRKFTNLFHQYDQLEPATPSGSTPSPALKEIIKGLNKLVGEARNDRKTRVAGGVETTKCLVRVINEVCERRDVRLTQRRQRGQSTGRSHLFQILIGTPPAESGLFILDVIEEFPGDILSTARGEMEGRVEELQSTLQEGDVPAAYLTKFALLFPPRLHHSD